jgi:hypothetical protein
MMRRISVFAVIALVAAPWLVSDVAGTSLGTPTSSASGHHAPHRRVLLTPHDGPSRFATLEGVGCSEAICSRVAVRTRAASGEEGRETLVRFDAIAQIRSNGAGHATVDFVDGSSRHVVIPTENRVFYVLNDSGRPEKLDMGTFAAVEFLR